MKYYARGLKDLLKTTQLNEEFFESLDSFQRNYIEMCFRQSYDEKIGLMGEVESYNYHIFKDFMLKDFEVKYGLEETYWKKVA